MRKDYAPEEDPTHPDHYAFTEGRKLGWEMAEWRPEVADAISSLNNSDPWIKGFSQGNDDCRFQELYFENYMTPEEGRLHNYNIEKQAQMIADKKDPEFIEYEKGYNQGYLLAKEMPEVAQYLAEIKSHQPWISGIRDGREQHTAEMLRDARPKWLDPDHSSKADFNKAKDRDQDKADPAPKKDKGDKDER